MFEMENVSELREMGAKEISNLRQHLRQHNDQAVKAYRVWELHRLESGEYGLVPSGYGVYSGTVWAVDRVAIAEKASLNIIHMVADAFRIVVVNLALRLTSFYCIPYLILGAILGVTFLVGGVPYVVDTLSLLLFLVVIVVLFHSVKNYLFIGHCKEPAPCRSHNMCSGIYAYKSAEDALRVSEFRRNHVAGGVWLFGDVIEHESGYRAEYAIIDSFIVREGRLPSVLNTDWAETVHRGYLVELYLKSNDEESGDESDPVGVGIPSDNR